MAAENTESLQNVIEHERLESWTGASYLERELVVRWSPRISW